MFQSMELSVRDFIKIEQMLENPYMDEMLDWTLKSNKELVEMFLKGKETWENTEEPENLNTLFGNIRAFTDPEPSTKSKNCLGTVSTKCTQLRNKLTRIQNKILIIRKYLIDMRLHGKKIEVEALLFQDNCPISYIFEAIHPLFEQEGASLTFYLPEESEEEEHIESSEKTEFFEFGEDMSI